jgi:L-lactate dehydrogenase (cytochrome)
MTIISSIKDLQELYHKRVPKMFVDYCESGSYTETTLDVNLQDLKKYQFKQRVGVNVEERSTKSKILGQETSMPLAISPVGMAGMQCADGEILAAQACEEFGVPYTLSTVSICSIEQVAAKTTKPFWFQLYVMRDKKFAQDLIARAKAAKCSALVVTLDLPVLGQRHIDLKNGLTAPPRFTIKNIISMLARPRWCLAMLRTKNHYFNNIIGHAEGVKDLKTLFTWAHANYEPGVTWNDIKEIKKLWGGKLIVKGIMTADDAQQAKDSGADAIIISNHGGRQLDGAPSTISQLESITKLVNNLEIYIDGGIRSGQDIYRALALGANAVMIGRPYIYGLGAMGRKGVTKTLEILHNELDVTMALTGVTKVDNIRRNNLL